MVFSHFMHYDKACTHPCSVLLTVSLCARAAQRALGHGICSNSAAVLLHRTAVPCPGARPERRGRNERGEGALAACPGPHYTPATSCSATASPSRAVTSSRCRGNRACAKRGGVRAGPGWGRRGRGQGMAGSEQGGVGVGSGQGGVRACPGWGGMGAGGWAWRDGAWSWQGVVPLAPPPAPPAPGRAAAAAAGPGGSAAPGPWAPPSPTGPPPWPRRGARARAPQRPAGPVLDPCWGRSRPGAARSP